MNMGDFRDANLSFLATPWRKFIGMFESAAERIKSAGRPLSSVRSSSSRKPAPTILAHSEQLFSAFMDNLPGFAWMKDIEGHYLYVNKRLEQLTPYQTGWLGKTDADLWPDEMAAIFRGTDQEVIATRKTLEIVEIYMVDGEQRHAWVSKFPIFDSAGAVVMVGGSSVDITKRIHAEEQLRQSESQLAEAQRLASVGSWNWDIRNNTHTWSDELCHMYGLHPQESDPSYETFIELVHPDDRAVISGAIEHALKTQEPINSYLRIIRPDGAVRIIHSRGNTICDISGTPMRMYGTVQDVTERKQAEAALQESEERFRQLSEAAFEAIILHDNGTILEVNQSFCRMYGYERAEVIGKSILDMALPQFRELFRQKLRSGDTNPYESPVLRKDGTVFNAELAGKPINYRGRVVRVGAIRDITEQKRNEQRQAAQYAVTRVLAESATLDDAIPKLLRVICESLRWKMGEFWRVCDSTNLLRCVETWLVPAPEATSFIEASRQAELAPGAGLPGRVWQSGQPTWIPDVMTDPRFARAAIAAKVGLRGAVAFPILLGNHTLGVMQFFSRRTPEVDEDLLKIMSAIGSQIGQFTERKQAEGALSEAEQKYRDIFENAGEGIFQSTPDGRFIAANPALARMHGFASPEELIESRQDISRQIYVDPTRREEFKKLLHERGAVSGFEHQIFRKDGSKIWITVNARAVRDERGAIRYYEGTAQNITARKLAEQALRESEERYRDLVENSRELICTHDLDGLILSANRAATEALGHDREDYFGKKNLREILTPVALEGFEDYLARIRNNGVASGIMLVQTSSGEHRIWEYYNTLRTEGVAAPIVRGMARDITDRKRAEEALRESEERYRELFENAKDATFVHDLSGRYMSVNRAAEKLIGYARAEILGKEFIHFFPPEQIEHIRECSRKLVDEGETAYESEVVTKDGRRVAVDVESHLIFEKGVPVGVQGTARDITERKAAEEKLKANSEQLRALSARLQSAREEEGTRIAREIHDELGSALTSLKWDLEEMDKMLSTSIDQSELAALREKLQAPMRLADTAISAIRRIASELRPSILDDLGLVAAIEWQAHQFQARTGIVCHCDCSLEKVELTEEQSTAVFRILQEALTNVLRHAQATKVDIQINKENGFLTLSVSDNGQGITESEKSQQQSLGILGMRERAHLIGGEIAIKGVEGKGTVVIVRVPTFGQDRVLKMTR